MNVAHRLLARTPEPVVKAGAVLLSFIAGFAVALMLYYMFYRVGLPSKPFIYVSF
jgi:hypothetical protein